MAEIIFVRQIVGEIYFIPGGGAVPLAQEALS
jgi:hypothetical protein